MTNIYEEVRIALYGIWHRRWLALGIAWVVCLLGWLVVAMVPNSYESKARIFVQIDDVLSDQIGIGGDRKRDIERVRQTLTSSVNLEKVVRATRLGDKVTSDKQMEGTVAGLGKTIKVVSQQDNLFEISATSGSRGYSDVDNAKLAQDIVQKMIDIFREENLAGGRGEMTDTLAFMDQQLQDRQKDLEAAEQKRQEFESKNAALMPGTGGLTGKIEGARAELRGVESDLLAAQSALAAINGQLSGTPPTLMIPGAAGGARGALAQAQADLSAMRARGLTDSHPDVQAIKSQMAGLSRQAAGEGGPVGTPNPAYISLQSIKADRDASLIALQSRKGSLQQEIAQLSAQQYSEPGVAAEASRINRDYDVLKEQYDKLLRDREQLRLRGQVESERNAVKFEVIDPPTTPRSPSAPDRPMLLALVLVAGLVAGCGTAFAVGQLRSSYSTTGQLERATGLPVIGSVSLTMTRGERSEYWRHLKWFAGATAALAVVLALLMALEFMKRGMVA
ncbi:Wzz/FepE/Etk N-terminal domain-containing protein [Novosphingobium sp. KCTC 2891]|uniref:XrtA system polysaccharide chain length determinant n=1 Tax=Novosphingobium sp. KCTC 2891 TaxID=2989730 RepID=UPI002221C6FF|nr:XrtA system polysaccharide chain length determinant [Novosphingobium sp. KCTC 2891]MCW1381700.1 Wzz/FepE/Etk N-terminal domain-containing protein [Novosphingobium sp. KCTC 2891]